MLIEVGRLHKETGIVEDNKVNINQDYAYYK